MRLYFKNKIEQGLELLARHIYLSPNTLTFISILCMSIAGYYIAIKPDFMFAGLLVFISGLLDLLDGTVAKIRNKTTRFGNFFDKFADRLNDIIILYSIIISNLVSIHLGLFVLSIIILASYVSAVIESLSRTNIGSALSLRGLRIMVLSLGLILNQILLAMIILAILGVVALAERMFIAIKKL